VSGEAGLNKAPDAFRTISEVAEELDLPQHVLRFWESRFPHIKPLKRGGGRRYYRPEDIDLLRGIRRLLYSDGYTIKGVQRILREQGVRTVQAVGQGQEVPNLAAPQDISDQNIPGDQDIQGGDAPGNESGANGEAADVLTPPDGRPFADAEDENGGPLASEPHAPVIMGRSAPLPKNGPMAGVGATAMPQVARVGMPKRQAPVASASPVAAQSSGAGPADSRLASPAAAPSLSRMSQGVVLQGMAAREAADRGLAAPDLVRLKQALAELEACRRLLDKAIEEGR
jgi:DNA-binding transcriptional MerR regulator